MAIISLKIDNKIGPGFVNISRAKTVVARNTLNTIAFLVRKNDIANIKADYILRNAYTTKSVQVEKAVGQSLKTMQSKTGILKRASYMALHEKGGTKKPKRGNTLAMPQTGARGGSKRRVVNRQVYLKNIKNKTLKWSARKGSKKSRTVAMAYMAKKTGLFMQYSKNIYKITSFSKSRNHVRFRKTHLYNVSQERARIKRNPHFEPALQQPVRDAQSIFNSQIRKELRKRKII